MLGGRLELGHREVADADHADVAVGPRLRGRPLHEVVQVFALGLVEERERPARPAGAAQVRDDVHVAARHEEVARAGLDEPHRRAEVLDLAGIRRCGDEHRERAGTVGPVDVGEQAGAVARHDRDVVLPDHLVGGRREVPVHPSRRLRTVERAFAGFGA